MKIQTTNDTGIHPTPGHILCEYVELFDNDKIVIPDHVRDAMEPSLRTHITVVVEDARAEACAVEHNAFPTGTHVVVAKAQAFAHNGRKYIFAKYDDVCGWIDAE